MIEKCCIKEDYHYKSDQLLEFDCVECIGFILVYLAKAIKVKESIYKLPREQKRYLVKLKSCFI